MDSSLLAKLVAQDLAIAAALEIAALAADKNKAVEVLELYERRAANQQVLESSPEFEQQVRKNTLDIFSRAKSSLRSLRT